MKVNKIVALGMLISGTIVLLLLTLSSILLGIILEKNDKFMPPEF